MLNKWSVNVVYFCRVSGKSTLSHKHLKYINVHAYAGDTVMYCTGNLKYVG